MLQILDSRGHKLFAKQDAQKGKFAFSVEEYEMIEMCFQTKFDIRKSVACVGFHTPHLAMR